MISKALSTSERFARLFALCPPLAEFAQSLYPLLLAHADDFGREAGDLFTVKHAVHPASPRSTDELARALFALHEAGLIVWYEVQGRRTIQIVKFDDHQSGLHKRTRSQFPAIPGNSGKLPNFPVPGISGNFPEDTVSDTKGSALTELNLTELNRTEEDQDQRAHARLVHIDDVRDKLLKAAHLELDRDPSISDSALGDKVKAAAAKCRALYNGRDIAKIADAARASHGRRFA
jgi:hypothetical protein